MKREREKQSEKGRECVGGRVMERLRKRNVFEFVTQREEKRERKGNA